MPQSARTSNPRKKQPGRAKSSGRAWRSRALLFGLGILAVPTALVGRADAQVGSANVPLPNVLLLLDTSGSFEHMIDGSNPEDTGPGPYNTNPYGNNNVLLNQYANCETAWNLGYAALPNRWGIAVQALTGTILNSSGSPFYSCVTMDRVDGMTTSSSTTGIAATVPGTSTPFSLSASAAQPAASVYASGFDSQYGLINEAGLYSLPYDAGYYLNFHRPVSQVVGSSVATSKRCVYSPNVLPGAINGGVGNVPGAGMPSATDCPNEGSGPCLATDFPADAIGQFYYSSTPSAGGPVTVTTPLGTPNTGYAPPLATNACSFNQATDGFIDQAASLVRFGLMTFDNDPSQSIGGNNTGSVSVPQVSTASYGSSPFLGQWSYFPGYGVASPTTYCSGMPGGCSVASPFELGGRNPSAPPWEGRLIGFPSFEADVVATAQANSQIQTAINAMRPYGATPTAGLMTDAEYYFWGDPAGPGATNPKPDPFVAGGCRPEYIILLTDGTPNQDLRTSCQAGGVCPYHLPEDTASVLATGTQDTSLPTVKPGAKVYTYVIGFAVSGNGDSGLANCAQLASTGALQTTCNTNTTGSAVQTDTTPSPSSANYATLESPCCSLQRIAVAGGTGQAYFADTPGDLNAALAAVLGDIEGQLGSRTTPVASPTVSYTSSGPITSTFVSTFHASSCPATGPCTSSGPWTGDVERQDYVCSTGTGGVSTPTPTTEPGDDFQADLVSGTQKNYRNFLFFNGYANGGSVGTNPYTLRPYLNSNHAITNGSNSLVADNLDVYGGSQDGTELSTFASSLTSVISSINSTCTSTYCPALAIGPTSCQDPASTQYIDPTSCANLALSFEAAQPTFTTASSTTAASQLASQYATGQDGPYNKGLPTNRSAYPMGAVLDSTPAVVGPPAAQVRDDSYQAFQTGLSAAVLGTSTPRDTMLYVATVDGILHAFDTSAGQPGSSVPAARAEAWAFVPPAVLPRALSNYPGAANVLLDGSPVVKDVIFSRTDSSGLTLWAQAWHTMLVAGFGAGGRGYYALDVTDPRAQSSDLAATDTTFSASGYPSQVGALTGPHFQWQITSANVTGNPIFSTGAPSTEIFGSVSGTPAIATVYADPTLPSSNPIPKELGIAILPGGRNGTPVPGKTCPRELSTTSGNVGNYSTQATLYTASGSGSAVALPANSPYNLSDTSFPPRQNVRAWSTNCSGPNSNVPGRSLMIVSVATGQVLAVFARAKSNKFSVSDPTTWDVPTYGSSGSTVIPSTYLIPTPLDSPLTGTPVVYPSGVGVVAQEIFIGDADGTMWRFDISDPNPRNWTGAIFADGYAPLADTPSQASTSPSAASPDWTALDSQPISVVPEIALDSTASLTMNFATGDQTAFNPCYSYPIPGLAGSSTSSTSVCTGSMYSTVSFLYSVRETRTATGSLPRAQVKWYQKWSTGERVTGPMAIFDNILYFATYAPAQAASGSVCSQGGPNLYAEDFANPPAAGCHSGSPGDTGLPIGCGGDGTEDPNFNPTGSGAQAGELTTSALISEFGTGSPSSPTVTSSTVIPGVSVAEAPSCTTTSSVPSDSYTGGAHTSVVTTTAGQYSLTANIGKSGGTAAQNLLKQKLQAPAAPTVVDSWATISE